MFLNGGGRGKGAGLPLFSRGSEKQEEEKKTEEKKIEERNEEKATSQAVRKEEEIFTRRSKEELAIKKANELQERTELTDFVWESLSVGTEIALQYSYFNEERCEPGITSWREAEVLGREGTQL